QAAAGVRKQGDGRRATIDDRWHLGSDTKAMTATLAAMLVDEKRLAWGSTVGEIFSDWKDLHRGFARVTLEMLLAHRGGAPAELSPLEWGRMWRARDPAIERTRAVHALLREPPGKVGDYRYSNFGYLVAGAMIEKVTGQAWEVVMRKRLFEPLKMGSCGFGAPASPGKIDQPWAHRRTGSGLEPVAPGPQSDNPPSLGPAGTVHCGLRDWAKFAQLHLDEARGKGTLVSAASLAKLHTPWPGGDYALGWLVERREGATVLAHDGSNTMFLARIWMVPAKNVAFLVATNAAGDEARNAMDRTVAYLRARYLK
ncbi:MAG TPA: serine hydrolase, partial [Polyangia bacterium]|nr:serine hydrolase [Polyangia bacterium]